MGGGSQTQDNLADTTLAEHRQKCPNQVPEASQDNPWTRDGPSRQRRRARRAADREAEEASNGEGQGTESAEDAEEAEKVAGKVTLLTVEVSDPPSSDVTSADEADDASKAQEDAAAEQADFPCNICDFRSTWANGNKYSHDKKACKYRTA